MWSAPRRLVGASAVLLLMVGTPGLVAAQVSATPDGAESESVMKATAGLRAAFSVDGRGSALLECWGTGGIECSVEPEVELSGPTSITVSFDTPADEGVGYLFLRVTQYGPDRCNPESATCDKHVSIASRIYTITAPPEPPRSRD